MGYDLWDGTNQNPEEALGMKGETGMREDQLGLTEATLSWMTKDLHGHLKWTLSFTDLTRLRHPSLSSDRFVLVIIFNERLQNYSKAVVFFF